MTVKELIAKHPPWSRLIVNYTGWVEGAVKNKASIRELSVDAVSPSGKYAKISGEWHEVETSKDQIEVLEVLYSRG